MYVVIYIAAVALANLTVAKFGPGVMPLNAFLLIGLDLAIRDRLHFRWTGSSLWLRMVALISWAGALSYAANPDSGRIAVASLVAFSSAAAASALVFQVAHRFSPLARANGANVAGAVVDSIIFPAVAFGTIYPMIAAFQFIAKVAGGAVWAWVVFRNVNA